MEATDAEIEVHSTLTTEEQIHCHKARIFSILIDSPVVRGWKDAICDGALYLGGNVLPKSYADRYFQTWRENIFYVTFSIVTAFRETIIDAEGRESKHLQCQISPAQCEASEFLIVTFAYDHETVALLPHRLYWPVNEDGSTGIDEAPPAEISASDLSEYCFSISFLCANIQEVIRTTIKPMYPTTTPFQIGLDGRIPKASTPEAIMPPPSSEQQLTDSDPSIYASPEREETALRTIRKEFINYSASMKIDFLLYQPLLRDFKIIVSSGEEFLNGLEVVINHSVGRLRYIFSESKFLFLIQRVLKRVLGFPTLGQCFRTPDTPVNRQY